VLGDLKPLFKDDIVKENDFYINKFLILVTLIFTLQPVHAWRWASTVGIATGWMTEG
jgi:hypothetical protein